MMSFLRKLALKPVMAAKKESVANCAGSLQYGVGRPANTMIKTIQNFAEADPTRVLVASRRALLDNIEQTDPELAACLLQMVHKHHHAQDAQD